MKGKKITPQSIIERHKEFPGATEQMIEYYANMKVKEHVHMLLKRSAVTQIPLGNNIIIVSDWESWKGFEGFSPLAGLDISILEKVVC